MQSIIYKYNTLFTQTVYIYTNYTNIVIISIDKQNINDIVYKSIRLKQ